MFFYKVSRDDYEQLVKTFGLPDTISFQQLGKLIMANSILNVQSYDRATVRAALRVGIMQNANNQENVNALKSALDSEDACGLIGNWAQDTIAQNNANQGNKAVAAGNWLAIFQLLLSNLPSIIALIMQLFKPSPPVPPQPTQPASGGK